jgi:hypothetical protein
MKYLRPSIVLFVVAFLAYGLLIPHLGFYWDDLPMSWIRYRLGSDALAKYLSVERPVWSVLFQLTADFLPHNNVYWQVFAFVWRWFGAVLVYLVIKRLWKDRPRMALGVALLYLIYPGFDQHFTAYVYSHFYIVIFFFLTSLLCMFKAYASPQRYWAWTIAGMVLSALNLWMMEYFFLLDLIRVALILILMRTEIMPLHARILRVLKLWAPYLVILILAVFSRFFVSNNQDYPMVVLSQLRTAPVETVISLFQTILLTLRLVLYNAWMLMFDLPDVITGQSQMFSYYFIVGLAILSAAGGFLLLPWDADRPIRKNLVDASMLMGLGLFAILLSGWPFWLIDYQVSLAWPASRFTISFMLGVSMFFGGLLSLIPSDRLRIVLFVSLVSFAVGKQYLTAQDYRHDWEMQKELFWQMTWRAPGIEPDTVILLNEGALKYYADNSLSAALNWIYSPNATSDHIEYMLFYPKSRLKTVALPKLETGYPIYFNYEAGEFHGNTAQVISMYYAPPGCLRILDPEVDGVNRLIPETSLMRFAARLTAPQLILDKPLAKMPDVYGPEPEHDFCYYFQKADLARQFGDWDTVVKMGEMTQSFTGHPFDPAEQLVFIEGYAHAGNWARAMELSKKAHAVSERIVGQMLCQLWKRIEAETGEDPGRGDALSQAQSMFICNP